MPLDPDYNDKNRASTARIRALVAGLSDTDYLRPVGEHWTVSIALVHLAFWDRRVLYALDMTEREGKFFNADVNVFVNDLSLPLWAAVRAREAARLAIETSEELDQRLEKFDPALLEEIYDYNKRWVVRALHRNEHLDEVDAALKGL